MAYEGTSDSAGISGVPAVRYARSQIINGQGCDIPNIQQMIRIYCDALFIDSIDPTAAANPQLALSQASGIYANTSA